VVRSKFMGRANNGPYDNFGQASCNGADLVELCPVNDADP
jgi:hypothetical protein